MSRAKGSRTSRWNWERVAALGGVAVGILGLTFGGLGHYLDIRDERNDLKQEASSLRSASEDVRDLRTLVAEYEALETYALQQRKLTQQEVSRFLTRPLTTRRGRPRPLQITDPAENARVPDGTMFRGTSDLRSVVSTTCWEDNCSRSLPRSHRTIWIVIQAAAVNRYYPQGSWPDKSGPALVNAVGEWNSPAVFFGRSRKRTRFLIHAVLASRDAEEAFKDHLRRAWSTMRDLGLRQTQLPKGAQVLDTVLVIRE